MTSASSSLTFLGTGTSVGVPVIGCDCSVCQSDDPRNKRLRSSILLRLAGQTLLVDTGPDLRQQALRADIRAIDAVLYTHAHVDHVAGFDELRAFCWHRDTPLPLYAHPECLLTLQTMYGWAFTQKQVYKGYVRVDPREIVAPFTHGDITITALPVLHGSVTTLGFRFDHPGTPSIAYMPDVKSIPESTYPLIQDIDILVIDSLGPNTHPTHLSTAESIAVARRSEAKTTYLTHCGHDIDFSTAELPDGILYATDTLVLPL